jgi:CubicO group peptidase (beta-lactamase class C family)
MFGVCQPQTPNFRLQTLNLTRVLKLKDPRLAPDNVIMRNPKTPAMKFKTGLLLLALGASCLARAASPLPVSSPEQEGIDTQRLDRVHELVASFVREGKHAGATLLIARNGKLVDWRAYGSRDLDTGAPMEKDTIFRIYSMTKMVTAIAALQLFEQGKLLLDSAVTNWLPELRPVEVFTGGTADSPQLEPVKTPITVRMLLNHTGGFTYDFFEGSPVHEIYKRADLWNSSSLDEFIQRVGRLPLLSQPGTAFHYSIGDDVLGVLIQRVSGERFEDYVRGHVTEPLKMSDTFFDVPVEKKGRIGQLHQAGPDGKLHTTAPILGAYAEPGRGIPCGGAGLFSTIGDYARLAQMLLNGGQLDGARILSRKTMELARLNSLTTTPTPYHEFSGSDGWGLFSAVRLDVARSNEPSSVGMLYWSGAATTHFFVDPQEQLAALVFCQYIPFDQYGLFTRFRIAVYQALE